MNLIISFIVSFIFFIQGSNIEKIRDQYPNANTSKANAESFYKLVNAESSNATINGYKSAATIVKAKFQVGERRKKIITDGIKSLESTIKSDPNNIELRVIRMSVQENLPKFIRYNTNITSDKAFVLKNYAAQNSALKAYIKKFAAHSKNFNDTEKASLK